ncbi:serine/threonine protein kinase [Candidatus Uabimicrobium amorphum]|uniref:Protein kinase n=1 Tax=Uabimicrobium amorphum TaxID=2596890 RepID=A0A5S9IK33_UABAM|nr:serine/threonine-protein kinase [Candidatus Uabimicrobium amorphum]BBM82997.1 protein kinase [Candidatus Uabimicrobium amorphum]
MEWQITDRQFTIRIRTPRELHFWIKTIAMVTCCDFILRIQHYFWPIIPNEVADVVLNLYYIFFILGIYITINYFKKPRKVIINFDSGTFRYFYFLASRKYYFAEVECIRIATDMSKALTKLKGNMYHRVYLKLRKQSFLFLGEFDDDQQLNLFINELRNVFDVHVDKLHKVGRKLSKEVRLGRYTIEKEISRGGMGKVFLARDDFMQKAVAIKVLPANLALKYDHANNFARETRILQKLRHPNIIQIYDVGREKGKKTDIYFYAMECIHGKPLSFFIKEKAITIEQSVRYAIQLSLALDYIHSHKVVHRDIKPENILIRNEGSCVLIDFGIARDISIRYKKIYKRVFRHQPEISHHVGTLPYMSPEQISAHHDIDYRTDIYSLGITLYEMLVFKRAFTGNSATILRAIPTSTPTPPSKENPRVPQSLDTIVMKAIAKNKNKRYQSGALLANDLHNWLHDIVVEKQQLNLWQSLSQKFLHFFQG